MKESNKISIASRNKWHLPTRHFPSKFLMNNYYTSSIEIGETPFSFLREFFRSSFFRALLSSIHRRFPQFEFCCFHFRIENSFTLASTQTVQQHCSNPIVIFIIVVVIRDGMTFSSFPPSLTKMNEWRHRTLSPTHPSQLRGRESSYYVISRLVRFLLS